MPHPSATEQELRGSKLIFLPSSQLDEEAEPKKQAAKQEDDDLANLMSKVGIKQ